MLGGLELLILIASAIGIGVLCYVWMKNSRASQTRMEQLHRETIELLREQNELLRKLGAENRN